jgi:hypothetical protein
LGHFAFADNSRRGTTATRVRLGDFAFQISRRHDSIEFYQSFWIDLKMRDDWKARPFYEAEAGVWELALVATLIKLPSSPLLSLDHKADLQVRPSQSWLRRVWIATPLALFRAMPKNAREIPLTDVPGY